MVGLEYTAFNINIIFGFICAILGVLQYSGNNIEKIVSLVGLGTGIIGFVLTFIYIIYSGIIFNNDEVDKNYATITGDPYANLYISTKPDGAFLKWKNGKYVCIYYDKDNKNKLYRKYSDYGNINLNFFHFDSEKKGNDYYKYSMISDTGNSGCAVDLLSYVGSSAWDICQDYENGRGTLYGKKMIKDESGKKIGECNKIYALPSTIPSTNEKRNLYNSWVTTIVFGCFIFVLDIALAIIGYLIFKDSKGKPRVIRIN